MKARRRGEIIRRGRGAFLVRWVVGTDVEGRRIRRSCIVEGTAADAAKMLREKLGEAERGVGAELPARLPLRQYLDDWYKLAGRKRRARTVDDYRAMMGRLLSERLAHRRLDRITPLDVERWVRELEEREGVRKLSPQTIRQAVAILGAALQDAVRLRLLAGNPARGVALPRRERREMRALTADEGSRFRTAASGTKYEALWLVLLGCGLRPSEALALRWSDVELDAAQVRVERSAQRKRKGEAVRYESPKTARGRRAVPIPGPVVAALARHQAAQKAARVSNLERLVFVGPTGRPLHEKNLLRRHFRPLLKAAKLDGRLRVYDLRHTFATAMLAAGTPVHIVAAWLGHASAKMTLDVYAHALPQHHAEAASRIETALFS